MLKLAIASLLLSASPAFPPPGSATPPAQVSAPDSASQPDYEALKSLANSIAEGPVTKTAGEPMHVKAILRSHRMDGIAMIVFENADGSLDTGLLVGWKTDAWMLLDGFTPAS